MTTIQIKRPPVTTVATIQLDERTVLSKMLLRESKITAEFIHGSVIALQIGDFVTYASENYYINRLPDIVKINNFTYKYKIDFESVLGNLKKKLFLSSDGLADFSYNGTASDFITNIVASINEIDSGWTVGTVDTSTEQTLQFSNESCRAALTRVAEAFKMEFVLSAKEISLLNAAGTTTAYSFTYGKGLGLYRIERQQVNDQNIITKVFGFGGTRNIAADYRSRAKRLVFETGDPALRYLTKNVNLYGTIEGQFTDDNIFPQRTGTLTAANIVYDDNDIFDPRSSYVADSALDFDINDYLIEGQTATIVFKTGALAGVECEIWKYDNSTKRIYFNAYSDPDGYTMPFYNGGSEVQPEIGDSYTLVNISMPQSYIDTAETALQAATQAYLDENSVPQAVYTVDLDPKYVSDESVTLDAGDKVTIVDTDLGIDALIRVAGIEFPLVNPGKIKAVIADFIPYTLQERLIKGTVTNRKETIFVDRRQSEAARRNTVRQKQLQDLLFDSDNYFDTGNIKPLSIETSYLAVGTKSRDFWLSNVTIKANYGGDENAINVTAGSLVHLQISIAELGYTWEISSALNVDSLTAGSAYYLYAKCSKAALTGQWVLSASQITVEEVSGYYHFLVGMLFAVADGYRDFDFTNGMTYIHGNQIKTGIVSSIDGNNYFDLTLGKFKIGNENSSLDFNVTNEGVVTLVGSLVQTPAGSFPVIVFCGAYDAGTTYQKGNQVTYGGSSWNYINNTPGSGHTPSEGAYWTQAAVKGTDGTDGTDGINGTNGTDGLSIVWHGDAANPDPSWEVLNHVYRDTDNGYVYIYNGTAWVLMVLDGSDGADGTDGTDGLSVFITYNDNAITSAPATPTGDGTTGGWHTTPAATCNWMSQKVAADASSGTWGAPIQITGADGADGDDGATGPGVVFRGVFSASTVYSNNALRRDIVRYPTIADAAYIFKGTDGTSGAWSAGNWESFGASFSSVATELLFAELAYVENLGVRYFNGVSIPVGDLAGTVVNTQANISLSEAWQADYEYSVNDKCSYGGVNYIATDESAIGVEPPSGWEVDPDQPQARIDTVTLTGTAGTANILCDGITKMAEFVNNLSETAAGFVSLYSAYYAGGGVVVTSSGPDIIFTSDTPGTSFTGSTTITNLPDPNRGAISIVGNQIWENSENSDEGAVKINMKGYSGGLTKYRKLFIGDGKGGTLLSVIGSETGARISLYAGNVSMFGLPTSDPATLGRLWMSSGVLKVSGY